MRDTVFLEAAERDAREHLLRHFRRGEEQENLCFGFWRRSTGARRTTAIVAGVILPEQDEVRLHGNVSFLPGYLGRAVRVAQRHNAGLAFLHSHPSPGWQDLSPPDVVAERDVISNAARATGFPLVGLTVGSDGVWSARFWTRRTRSFRREWCRSVRVVGRDRYRVFFNDRSARPAPRRNILRRTFDSWGERNQRDIARLRVGVVGLGSVGSVVAESLARVGVSDLVFIDPDRVEEHNLDRLLNTTESDLGRPKVAVARRAARRHATARAVRITVHALPVQDETAYLEALDCDFLFSCVDRPVARDVLNHLAIAHLIPVVDGGVAVEVDPKTSNLRSAHWKAHLVTPHHRCLRCAGQYDSGMVVTELNGSLDDPAYIANLPPERRPHNENVFPFSLSVAGLEVNAMLRYLIADDWWPRVAEQDYQFVTGRISLSENECRPHCSFRARAALGDSALPLPYLTE